MPWAELFSLVVPHYSEGEMGRKPAGFDIILRVHFLQQWFALSGPAVEDALYESPVLRAFAGIDLVSAPEPDETTILNLRHLLEEHDPGGRMLDATNLYLAGRGIRITLGSIVDATIILAPWSTKSERREHHPEMYQTRKGNQWFSALHCTLVSIPRKAWCIRCAPRRRAFPMFTCCRTYCMVARRKSGATPITRDKRRRSLKLHLPSRI